MFFNGYPSFLKTRTKRPLHFFFSVCVCFFFYTFFFFVKRTLNAVNRESQDYKKKKKEKMNEKKKAHPRRPAKDPNRPFYVSNVKSSVLCDQIPALSSTTTPPATTTTEVYSSAAASSHVKYAPAHAHFIPLISFFCCFSTTI